MRKLFLAPLVFGVLSAFAALPAAQAQEQIPAPTVGQTVPAVPVAPPPLFIPTGAPACQSGPLCVAPSPATVCVPQTIFEEKLVKGCVAVPAKEVRVHISYGSRCKDFCVPECCLLGCLHGGCGHKRKDAADPCAEKGKLAFLTGFSLFHKDKCETAPEAAPHEPSCSKVRTRKVLMKRVHIEECDTYKCAVTVEPKQVCRTVMVRVPANQCPAPALQGAPLPDVLMPPPAPTPRMPPATTHQSPTPGQFVPVTPASDVLPNIPTTQVVPLRNNSVTIIPAETIPVIPLVRTIPVQSVPVISMPSQ